MSWQATAWAERQITGSPARKVLLLVLANYADEDGLCWPSQDTLSRGTEQSVDTIQRQLRKLEQLKLISIAARPQGRGRWPGRTYHLKISVAEKTEPQSAAQSDDASVTLAACTEPQPARDHAATSTPHHAANSTATMPQALRHEPSKNYQSKPSVEPSTNTGRNPSAASRQRSFERKRQSIEVLQNQIAHRLGRDGWLMLGCLNIEDLDHITGLQERGRLDDQKLEMVRLQYRRNAA